MKDDKIQGIYFSRPGFVVFKEVPKPPKTLHDKMKVYIRRRFSKQTIEVTTTKRKKQFIAEYTLAKRSGK